MTHTEKQNILVLGATGMLGNVVFRSLSEHPEFKVFGSVRSDGLIDRLPAKLYGNIIHGVEVESDDSLRDAFIQSKPDVVINCIGLVKQLHEANDPLRTIPINTILPHRLARLCADLPGRLIHVSTDCVFDGKKGGYVETDPADAQDLYGKSKHLGEVDYPHAITLRTSIIGPEFGTAVGLLGWFLASHGQIQGHAKAIFSGLPTIELSEIIRSHVIPRRHLRGVYHVAAAPISKYDLLKLVAQVYGKNIKIVSATVPAIDRSLNADRFFAATGYCAPDWPTLIKKMYAFG